eukprot:scaffold10094_cov128-Isochrysis_galbana.AAC.6
MGWWRNERALECAQYLVQLEALADVICAFRADAVGPKTARAKQGAIAAVSPSDNEASTFCNCKEASTHSREVSALFILRASPMHQAPSTPILLLNRLRGPNNEQPQIVSPADNIAEHLLTWDCGEASAHSSVGHADVLGAFRADAVAAKTARAKQGATTHCEPLLTTRRTHLAAVARTSERALERGEHSVALEGLANVLGTLIANLVVV